MSPAGRKFISRIQIQALHPYCWDLGSTLRLLLFKHHQLTSWRFRPRAFAWWRWMQMLHPASSSTRTRRCLSLAGCYCNQWFLSLIMVFIRPHFQRWSRHGHGRMSPWWSSLRLLPRFTHRPSSSSSLHQIDSIYESCHSVQAPRLFCKTESEYNWGLSRQ